MMEYNPDLDNQHDYFAMPVSKYLSFIRNTRIRASRLLKQIKQVYKMEFI